MFFNHNDEGLQICFDWKERINFFLTGKIKLNKKSSYTFHNHLLHLVSNAMIKYGDGTKHGTSKNKENINE